MPKKLTMKRSTLKMMVSEELARHFLSESPPEKVAADSEDKEKKEKPPKEDPKNVVAGGETTPDAKSGDDVSDKQLDKQTASPEDGKESFADELVGKTLDTVTMTDKSKILPGATELVMTFTSGDPLRILVSKSGNISFFYAGALHNEI